MIIDPRGTPTIHLEVTFVPTVILPDDLTPLPVSPRGDDPSGSSHVAFEDFVSAGDVRKVLLGAHGELPVECFPADDFDSFAGRADLHFPPGSPFRSKSGRQTELRVPDLALEPQVIHPAFEVLPPSARRAAPPKAAAAVDCEASFGNSRLADRWWVIGMGLAAAAVLFSGTLVDFISREAVRRSLASAPLAPELIRRPQPEASAPPAKEEPVRSLAATLHPDDGE